LVAHLLVGKAKHSIACGSEDRFALRIPLALFCVNASIKLDGKAALNTAEINNERTNWVLSPEFQTIQSTSPQLRPEQVFSPRLANS
jgi:hypothetical protein